MTRSGVDRCSPTGGGTGPWRETRLGVSWNPAPCWSALRDNVAEKVRELQEVCNLDYLLVEFTHPGIPLQRTLKNLENFATKVMPRFTGG